MSNSCYYFDRLGLPLLKVGRGLPYWLVLLNSTDQLCCRIQAESSLRSG